MASGEHHSERSSHAIYGLIIITSALVADREHAADALTSLTVLWRAGLVLVLAPHLLGDRGRGWNGGPMALPR